MEKVNIKVEKGLKTRNRMLEKGRKIYDPYRVKVVLYH